MSIAALGVEQVVVGSASAIVAVADVVVTVCHRSSLPIVVDRHWIVINSSLSSSLKSLNLARSARRQKCDATPRRATTRRRFPERATIVPEAKKGESQRVEIHACFSLSLSFPVYFRIVAAAARSMPAHVSLVEKRFWKRPRYFEKLDLSSALSADRPWICHCRSQCKSTRRERISTW